MKLKYFCGACIVVGAALLKAGAPILAVAAGIVLTALLTFAQQRKTSRRA
jgi:hypothetical protein